MFNILNLGNQPQNTTDPSAKIMFFFTHLKSSSCYCVVLDVEREEWAWFQGIVCLSIDQGNWITQSTFSQRETPAMTLKKRSLSSFNFKGMLSTYTTIYLAKDNTIIREPGMVINTCCFLL